MSEAEFVGALVNIAAGSKLAGLLLPVLARAGKGELAAEARGFAAEVKRIAMLRNSHVLDTIGEVDAALRSAGIAYVIMKGPLQQFALYGDYFVRPSGDVDLLVASHDFHRAIAAIEALGFSRTPAAPSLWWDRFLGERHLIRQGRWRANVDVHHRLQQPGSPQPRSTEVFLARAQTHVVRGVSVPVLRTADIPLLSALSLVKALFNREPAGNHAFDLLKALDGGKAATVGEFIRLAREEDLEGTARMALRLLGALFPALQIDDPSRRVFGRIARETLCAMVLQPDAVATWPQRRQVLREACLNRPARMAREFAWLGASEVARWAGERRSRGEAPASTHVGQAT